MPTSSRYVQNWRTGWSCLTGRLTCLKEGSAMSQVKLWQTQQGSVLENGRHGPCPCHHLQEQAQNSKQMGEQRVCGGMATLSIPTGICCTSYRWGTAQPYPAQKLPVAHQQQSGTGGKWKPCGGDGSSDEGTPVPQGSDALPVNCLTKSWLEGMPNSPSQQHKSFDPGSTGSTRMDPTDGGLQADKDAPVASRWSLRTMRNQPPWRY